MSMSRRALNRWVLVGVFILVGMVVGELSIRGLWVLWVLLGVLALVAVLIFAIRNIEMVTAGIFVLLLLGEILGNRYFSHFVVGKPPLYITEVGMFVVGALLLMQAKLTVPARVRKPFFAIMLVSAGAIVLNVFKYPAVSVLRDSAELYYMLFVPLSYSVFKIVRPHLNRRFAEKSAVVMAFVAPLVYIATKSVQIPAASETIAASIILFEMSWDWRHVQPGWVWMSVCVNLVAMVDAGARGPWIAFLVGILVLLVVSRRLANLTLRQQILRRLGYLLGMVFMATVLLGIMSPSLLRHFERDFSSVASLAGSYSQVANNRWRLIIWGEALRQFLSNPLALRVGQQWMPIRLLQLGYGGVNTQGYGLNTVTLSNSYLQMLQWYGLWAVVPFWWFVVEALGKFVKNIQVSPLMCSLVGVLSIWAINCGVEVVLEGPYMSALVWTLIGFGFAYVERRSHSYASSH